MRARAGTAALLALLLAGCSAGALQVSEAGIGETASYFWLGSRLEGARERFSPADRRVTLAVRLAPNLIGYYQTFRVEWLAPGGGVYLRAPAFTRWGSHQELAVSLPIAGTPAARLPGRWKVRLFHGERLLVERTFEIVPAARAAGQGPRGAAKEPARGADQSLGAPAPAGRPTPFPDQAPEE